MLLAQDILDKLDDKTVISIMEENGSPLFRETRDGRTGQICLWFTTICHGGDSHKLCYFTESKDFYCYTCCGKMSFFDFICRIRDIQKKDFAKAVKYVADKLGLQDNKRYGVGESLIAQECAKEFREAKKECETIKNKKNKNYKNKQYEANILNYFDGNTFYKGWIDEGISIETMKKFDIRWYEYQKHIIIPHLDKDGGLIGIRRRSLKIEDANNKYMPEFLEGVTYEHSLGLNLYGLYQNKEEIQRRKEAVIVEAEKSVLMSDTMYKDKSVAVATCGFNISNFQLKLLLELNVNVVYLGFDKDFDLQKENEYKKIGGRTWANYLRYKKRLQTLGEKLSDYFTVYLLRDKRGLLDIKDSPFDKGKEVFEQLLKDKKKIKKD